MYPGQVLELIHGRLARRDAEFVLQLPRSSGTDTELILLDLLFFKVVQWVGAAGVGPHVGEGDFLGGALLEEQLAVGRAEYECGEGAVEEAFVDVLHKMAC